MKRITDYKDNNMGAGADDHNNNNHNFSLFRYLCTIKELPVGKSRQFSVRNAKGTKEIQIAVFNVDGKDHLARGYWTRKRKL